jgi:hypothetical protein
MHANTKNDLTVTNCATGARDVLGPQRVSTKTRQIFSRALTRRIRCGPRTSPAPRRRIAVRCWEPGLRLSLKT